MSDPRQTRRYRTARAAFIRSLGPLPSCGVCGEIVDVRLSGRAKYGPQLDHKVPVSAGGAFWNRSNWQLVHGVCNRRKGEGPAVSVSMSRPPAEMIRRGCVQWKPGDGWQPASPNALYCDVSAAVCPHDKWPNHAEMRAKWSLLPKENR